MKEERSLWLDGSIFKVSIKSLIKENIYQVHFANVIWNVKKLFTPFDVWRQCSIKNELL